MLGLPEPRREVIKQPANRGQFEDWDRYRVGSATHFIIGAFDWHCELAGGSGVSQSR